MKLFLLFLVLLFLSRIGTNEAIRTLDETHLLLPSLQIHPPVKIPSLNSGTEATRNMASRVIERNFVGCKKFFAPTTNAYPLNETNVLLPTKKTCSPVKTPSLNPAIEATVNISSTITERNFVVYKDVFTHLPLINAYPLDETHLLLASLETRPSFKTPSPNPEIEVSVNMTNRVTERNFVGLKEVIFSPPPSTNAYTVDETHLLLPSLKTRPPVKTPITYPGTEARVNMASTEKKFVGHKEVVLAPPPPPLHQPLLLPCLQTLPTRFIQSLNW
ncbi:hypothetical protein P3S68_012458 [Capsicum galapagoense]